MATIEILTLCNVMFQFCFYSHSFKQQGLSCFVMNIKSSEKSSCFSSPFVIWLIFFLFFFLTISKPPVPSDLSSFTWGQPELKSPSQKGSSSFYGFSLAPRHFTPPLCNLSLARTSHVCAHTHTHTQVFQVKLVFLKDQRLQTETYSGGKWHSQIQP